jgi:hypothetical protein
VLGTYVSYQLIMKDLTGAIGRVGKQPVVSRETEYYLKNIGKIKTAEEFVADRRLFTYAMKAFGLEEMAYAKAFMLKAMNEGVADPDSFANRLTDKRYAEFVKTFNFHALGEATTGMSAARELTVERYMRQSLEDSEGEQNTGVKLALYFQRKAPTASSYYAMLGDKALAQVLYKAFNLPDAFAMADIDRQVAFFESRMDIADFKDPVKLDRFVKRFTAMWDATEETAAVTSPISILLDKPAEAGISTSLLLQLQQMKR